MRRSGLAAVIVALIVPNVWRWWPADVPQKQASGPRQATTSVQDLRLAVRAPADDTMPRVERNIFQLRRPLPLRAESRPVVARAPRQAPAVLPVAQALPPEPPPKTPEQIEAEAAQAELAQIRLVGVIFRDAKPRAYFSRGDQTYLVSLGDAVERFTVTAINAEGATLHDPRTQVGRVIPVLGK